MSTKVKLTYFKKTTGKYYSEGEYDSESSHLYDMVKEVNEMAAKGKLPGLVDGATEFFVYINPRSEEDCVPHLCNVKKEG